VEKKKKGRKEEEKKAQGSGRSSQFPPSSLQGKEDEEVGKRA